LYKPLDKDPDAHPVIIPAPDGFQMQVLKLRGEKALSSAQYHGIHPLLLLVAVRSHDDAIGILGNYLVTLSGGGPVKRHKTKPRSVSKLKLAKDGSDAPLLRARKALVFTIRSESSALGGPPGAH
jgi:hypothetical protein